MPLRSNREYLQQPPAPSQLPRTESPDQAGTTVSGGAGSSTDTRFPTASRKRTASRDNAGKQRARPRSASPGCSSDVAAITHSEAMTLSQIPPLRVGSLKFSPDWHEALSDSELVRRLQNEIFAGGGFAHWVAGKTKSFYYAESDCEHGLWSSLNRWSQTTSLAGNVIKVPFRNKDSLEELKSGLFCVQETLLSHVESERNFYIDWYDAPPDIRVQALCTEHILPDWSEVDSRIDEIAPELSARGLGFGRTGGDQFNSLNLGSTQERGEAQSQHSSMKNFVREETVKLRKEVRCQVPSVCERAW